jgi:cholest-4-en-3-one 26-monooxygenase
VACLDHPSYQGEKLWVVTRYADVQQVSRDASTYRNAPDPFIDDGINESASGGSDQLMISLDAPDHMKLRKIINKGFTPKRVAELGDMLRTRTNDIIDGLAGQTSADLVHDLALWLPLHVIADMVGVPEEDRAQVFDWTEKTFGFDASVTPEERAQAATDMFMYADAMCAERAENPSDDLMSVLLHAEVEGEKLTAFQIELFFMLLQNAGSETTRNLITTGTLALLQNRDQYEIVRNDLSVIPTAIEELLRFSTPVIQFTRTATVDTELGGKKIKAGERVLMVYASANRDERAFENPDAPLPTADVALASQIRWRGMPKVLAYIDGVPVGSGMLTLPVNGCSEIAGICTLQDYRGRGVATQIVAHLLRIAQSCGITLAYLAAADDAAARIYMRAGFAATGLLQTNIGKPARGI